MSISHLYDDMLLYLAKYLHPRDHLPLALSGESERFSVLYGTSRERLVLSECYYLSNKSWKRFFKDYISPSSITVCDVSHCYWLKAKVLLRCIIKLPNLEELYIQDTRMSLRKMPQVFEACQKIVKLSLTLKEDNLDEFKKGVIEKSSRKWIKKGFKKITRLELFAFVVPNCSGKNYNGWLAVLGVLKWCQDCTDLIIHITCKEPTNDGDEDSTEWSQECENFWKKLKPRFAWMKALKSLVILGNLHFEDPFMDEFLDWVREIQGWKFDLERLWGTLECDLDWMNGSSVKSFAMPHEIWGYNFDVLQHERFRKLEHLADIEFDRFEHQTELKYLCGESIVAYLDDIFECHKKLEQLHFYLKEAEEDEHYILNLGDWDLPLLKDLVIWSDRKPDQRVLDHLFNACANIDQAHFRYDGPLSSAEMASFSNSIRFNRLTWLTIHVKDLFNGSYLPSILKSCPNLERLFLNGNIEANTFFLQLSECIPTARNLRDLRVEWTHLQEDFSDLLAFFKALKRCPTLERLVLHAVGDYWKTYQVELQDSILPFVKELPHLVALGLAGFPIEEGIVESQLTVEIVPNRPAFWFHFGPCFPLASDLAVPRIHLEEILRPIEPYLAPPCF